MRGLTRTEARAVSRQGYSGLKATRAASSEKSREFGYAARIRDTSSRIEGETAWLKVPGQLHYSDMKSSALRVPSYKII